MKQKTIHRRLKGKVVSARMAKTVVVEITQLKKNAKYQRYYRSSKRFKAHDEKGEYRQGDYVVIEETRPLSRQKRFRVVELIEREKKVESEPEAKEEQSV